VGKELSYFSIQLSTTKTMEKKEKNSTTKEEKGRIGGGRTLAAPTLL